MITGHPNDPNKPGGYAMINKESVIDLCKSMGIDDFELDSSINHTWISEFYVEGAIFEASDCSCLIVETIKGTQIKVGDNSVYSSINQHWAACFEDLKCGLHEVG